MIRAPQTPYTFLGQDLQEAFPLVLEYFDIPSMSFSYIHIGDSMPS